MHVEIGSGRTIPGFDQGILGMCPGQQRQVTIPPELAYGDKGIPPHIPPQSTLIFELECVNIERPSVVRDIVPFLRSISPFFIVVLIVVYLFQRVRETTEKKPTTPTVPKKSDKKKKR